VPDLDVVADGGGELDASLLHLTVEQLDLHTEAASMAGLTDRKIGLRQWRPPAVTV
jgi:hypothetical protein